MKKIITVASLAISLAACLQPAATPIQAEAMDIHMLQVSNGEKEEAKPEPSATEENPDFVINAKGILTKYKGKAKVVTVPDGVTRIGSRAFDNNHRVEKVILPDTVTSIGRSAFRFCDKLKVVEANNLELLEEEAFWYSVIETIDLSHVKVIEATAFFKCRNLKNVDLGKAEKIGNSAFEGCVLLTEADLKSVEEIGDMAFYDCDKLATVTGFERLKAWGDRSFYRTPFIERCADNLGENQMLIINGILVLATDCSGVVTIPDEVKEIGGGAFAGSKVTQVIIPEHITKIGNGAFSGSELSSVNIPDGVKVIGANTFARTENLLEIVLPDDVEEIGDGAFYYSSIESINMPMSLKRIGNYAFDGTNITFIVLPEGVESIGDNAFANTSKLKTFSMKDSVTEVGEYAFMDSGVQDIRLSHNLTEIKSAMFAFCRELGNLTLPSSIEKLDSSIFVDARKTKIVTMPPWVNENVVRSFNMKNYNVKTVYTTELISGSDLEKVSKGKSWSLAELALTTNRVHLGIGTKFALRFNSGAKAEKWKSSNKKVVTVDSVGNLYAKGEGKATVTAMIYGKEYRCEVTVK